MRSSRTPAGKKQHPGKQPLKLAHRLWRPSAQDWHIWAVQLRALVEAGFPLIRALQILTEGLPNRRQQKTIRRLADQLTRGVSLTHALDDKTIRLPRIVRGLLAVGDSTGRYDEALGMIARHYARFNETLQLIKGLLWYPFACVVVGTVLKYVTEVIISVTLGGGIGEVLLAGIFTVFLPVTLGCVAGWIVGEVMIAASLTWIVDKIALHTPLVSKVSKVCSTDMFLSVFSTTLEAGVPLPVSYGLAADAMPNQEWAKLLRNQSHFLQDGEAITTTLRKSGLFDQTGTAMLAAGEVSAEAPKLMRKLTEYHDRAVRELIKSTIHGVMPLLLPSLLIMLLLDVEVLTWLAFITVLLITVNSD